MHKNITFFILLFIAPLLWAQETEVVKEDFNKDGIEDYLECFSEWGSNFGGTDCKLTDGKTKHVFELSNFGCFCEIKSRLSIPKELGEPKNELFLKTLKAKMFGHERRSPDASLQWIIETTYTKQKTDDNPYFEFIFTPKTNWLQGEMEFPTDYTIAIPNDSLARLIPMENDSVLGQYAKIGYLRYSGKIHLTHNRIEAETYEFIPAVANDSYEILETMHGVLVKKEETSKWLFVSDMHSNSSPQKLRWKSIQDVILLDDYVLIRQRLAPDPEYALYLIHIETGIGGRLKVDFDNLLEHDIEFVDLSHKEQFSIVANEIRIGNEIKTIRIPLEKVKKNLDSFDQSE